MIDLFSRRIVGWAIDKRMTQSLVSQAMMQTIGLRQPPYGLVFHSGRGSQYTSKSYQRLLKQHHIRSSIGEVGACWDNAVVERFFGSLKHDWLFKVDQPSREHMKQDVTKYMHYYNNVRLHSSNENMSPVNYELSKVNVCCLS